MNEAPDSLDLRSADIADEKKRHLLRLFPEAATEGGKLDFERLKLALGEAVDVGKERYGMNWPGKAECFRTIQAPSLATLRPCPDESVNFSTTENLIIEGDNLEVLKLLQKSHLGAVKMIYIDPPYNTGRDFIYPDDFTESLDTYLEYTGQVDAEGRVFGTNTDTDGRFHSKWLSMMYPRLYLARNLLREDGVLFVSIDDGELFGLLGILREVFGEENHLATLIHQRAKGGGQAKHVVKGHDYVLVFARNLGVTAPLRRDKVVQGRTEVIDGIEYLVDDDVVRKQFGKYDKSLGDRRCFYEELLEYKGQAKKDEIDSALAKGELFLERWDNGLHVICKRTPIGDASSKLYSILKALSEEGKKDLEALGVADYFDYPKPVDLVRQLVRSACGGRSSDLVLDFFAGSGTTAQAVLELNQQDGGDRRFILVQLPEPCEQGSAALTAGFKTIADVCKERVRRAIERPAENGAAQLNFADGVAVDRGFRVFKLAESNLNTWNPTAASNDQELAKQLDLHVAHIREGRSDDDLLYELLLKSGFSPTVPVEALQVAGVTVHSVAGGALLICLARKLTIELIRAIAEMSPERVVCLDEGFAGLDQLKANAVQIFKTKGITSFKTV